jgi:predicted RNase H-related nuclease YkuK (DUF458 family)
MVPVNWKNKTWYDPTGHFYTFEEVVQRVHCSTKEHEVHVGADSHVIGSKLILAVAICLYRPGKGGTYFFCRNVQPRRTNKNLGLRLSSEVAASISVADSLALSAQLITVHADVSANPRHKSFQYSQQICSFIKGMGYTCKIKPESWASSSVADLHAK